MFAPMAKQSTFEINQNQIRCYLEKERDLQNSNNEKSQMYDHQIDALLESADHYKNKNRSKNIGLIQIPTGGGKSGIITLLPFILGSHKVLVLSPGIVITNQLYEDFTGKKTKKEKIILLPEDSNDNRPRSTAGNSFYCKKKIVNPEYINDFIPHTVAIKSKKQFPDMSASDLVIVNAQKFSRTKDDTIHLNGTGETILAYLFKDFDTIIVDEAHHYPAGTWCKILDIFADRKIVFLTATPKPVDEAKTLEEKKKLEDIYPIYGISRKKLEKHHIIRKIEFIPLNYCDMNKPNPDELKDLAEKMKDTLTKHDNDVESIVHKAMVLVQKKIEYTISTAEKFNAINNLNLKATFCISGKQSDDNKIIFDRKDAYYRIMVVCQRLTEGYDNSNVSVCAILRNIGSSILFSQFVGRCIRISHDRENLEADDVTATVFGPQAMWDKYDKNATEDPVDDDADDDDYTNESTSIQ